MTRGVPKVCGSGGSGEAIAEAADTAEAAEAAAAVAEAEAGLVPCPNLIEPKKFNPIVSRGKGGTRMT